MGGAVSWVSRNAAQHCVDYSDNVRCLQVGTGLEDPSAPYSPRVASLLGEWRMSVQLSPVMLTQGTA